MRVLDLDMDFFMERVAHFIGEGVKDRLPEDYDDCVWGEERVRSFLKDNLGMSKERKFLGRVLGGHDEALYFWEELISSGQLVEPFDVVHVDSHADLGFGCLSLNAFLYDDILTLPIKERRKIRCIKYKYGSHECKISIADYLLWAIAYGYISNLTYCGNPLNDQLDDISSILYNKKLMLTDEGNAIGGIQLMHCNRHYDLTYEANEMRKESKKDIEVGFVATNNINNMKYNGDFDFVSIAQSPNYTPKSADFILDVFKEYINEI